MLLTASWPANSGVLAATDLRTGQSRWTLPVVGLSYEAGVGLHQVVISGIEDTAERRRIHEAAPPRGAARRGA